MNHIRMSLASVAVAAIGLCLAAPIRADNREIANAPAGYRHHGTDTVFAASAGAWQRTKVIEYNEDGSDASASYELLRDGKKIASATMYVYPMIASDAAARDAACADEYGGIKQAVAKSYRNVRVEREDTAGSPSPRIRLEGRHASFRFDGNFAGVDMPLKSAAYLYCPPAGKWYVQYRATWPATRDGEDDVSALIATLRWSDVLAR